MQVPSTPQYYTFNFSGSSSLTENRHQQLAAGDLPDCTPSGDIALLQAFKDSFTNGNSVLSDWVGNNPCTRNYMGVYCTDAYMLDRM